MANKEVVKVTKVKAPAKQSLTGDVTDEQKELIKNTVAKGATDDELKLFLYTAKRLGLDPITRQIHFVKRKQWDNETRQYKEVGTIQTGIDGYRVAAARTDEHAGTDDAIFIEQGELPKSASVTVYRLKKGERYAFTATAMWNEYAAVNNKTNELMGLWKKMPRTMLAKCAEALALRKGFPEVLAGTYTKEEMDQADGEPAYTESGNHKGTITQPQIAKIHAMIAEQVWDLEEVNTWVVSKYGARISGLSIEQAAQVIDLLEQKISMPKLTATPEPTIEEAVPAPEETPEKVEWIEWARMCASEKEALEIVTQMGEVGVSDAQRAGVVGLLKGRGYNV